jgi:hypothetical protein
LNYHKNGEVPQAGEVFVFGSNLAGVHGAGAALEAMKNFGAKWKYPIGLVGQSYAIPTKDLDIITLDIAVVKSFIEDFVVFTKRTPNVHYFVTAVGCGLAGFKDSEIAPLFKGCSNLCSFPDTWKPYLED